ncbi:uncharacterized protein EV422DRAFT_623679 [Fimicolochytrium jonesii]|uniref:uncharacterized protein n=1 Tax=Fimicolochytrium jonesii TaxID=1396493 RepID=UPI0022FEE2FE|nr:uncharacterized protein EV422DRAFT_623679 [Fimicolochytrium jonesii]KAI8816177.1 hypothetical protein EV422DRAFT_623679 [Fimicolochytrium jonesii]
MTAPSKPTDPKKSAEAKAEDTETAAAKLKNGTAAIALEEDDMFEDFEADAWEETEEDQLNIHQWEDTWADDDDGEDFAVQLQSEAAKRKTGSQPMKL